MQLKMRSKGTALVQDHKYLANGVKAFIGWKHNPLLGADVEVMDEKGAKRMVRQGGFERIEEVVTVDASDPEHLREYAVAMGDGDIFPGDEDAAELARSMTGKPVKFDPKFGGQPTAKTTDQKKGD